MEMSRQTVKIQMIWLISSGTMLFAQTYLTGVGIINTLYFGGFSSTDKKTPIRMGLSIIYFKGSQVEISKYLLTSEPEDYIYQSK